MHLNPPYRAAALGELSRVKLKEQQRLISASFVRVQSDYQFTLLNFIPKQSPGPLTLFFTVSGLLPAFLPVLCSAFILCEQVPVSGDDQTRCHPVNRSKSPAPFFARESGIQSLGSGMFPFILVCLRQGAASFSPFYN